VSRRQRSTFAAIGIVIVVVAVALIAGGGQSPGPAQGAGGPALVTVVGGEPDGGVKVLAYRKGDRVRLTVQSDRADVVHVHGYDLRVPVRMAGAARFSFAAKIEGEFVIELERTKRQIAALRVRP
jgi:FtsP/CotA-like multicopper oxidase with cupredoxin domain